MSLPKNSGRNNTEETKKHKKYSPIREAEDEEAHYTSSAEQYSS
jgi:hypothetical protein